MFPIEFYGILSIALVVFVCGIFGGATAYFRDSRQIKTGSKANVVDWKYPVGYFFESIAASAIVPLVLSTIGSDDIKIILEKADISGTDVQLSLVRLVGFCLIASLGSRRFIDNASARVFKLEHKMEEVQKKGDLNSSKIDTIADVVIEDDKVRPIIDATANLVPERDVENSPMLGRILDAFAQGVVPARSIQGLALSLACSEEDIRTNLSVLERKGLVRAIETFRGERWILTARSERSLPTK